MTSENEAFDAVELMTHLLASSSSNLGEESTHFGVPVSWYTVALEAEANAATACPGIESGCVAIVDGGACASSESIISTRPSFHSW